MIKILSNDLIRLGVIKNAISATRTAVINSENVLDINAVLDSKLGELVDENSIYELDDDYFDTAFFKKAADEDGLYSIEVEADHVSYRLNKSEYDMEYFAETGTHEYVLGKILEGTEFEVGVIEYSGEVTYSTQEKKSRRLLLMEFVAYLGGEIEFHKFQINIRQHIGSVAIKPALKNRNVKVISKSVNKRELDESGNPTVSYSCTPINIPIGTYSLGDNIMLMDKKLGIGESLRVVRISYNPYDESETVFDFANYINGLEDDLYRIETQAIIRDKVYHGCRIGPDFGFESILSNKMARAFFNSTSFKMQTGDGTGENWIDALWFDPSIGKFRINGLLELVEGLVVGGNVDLGSAASSEEVNLAFSAAQDAQNDASNALELLDDIASDSKVTPSEKTEAKQKWDIIVAEGNSSTGTIILQANTFGVSHSAFDTDYNALNTYLNETLNIFGNMSTTTDIVRTTWNTKWVNYYDERTKLINATAAKAKEIADNSIQKGVLYNKNKFTTENGHQILDLYNNERYKAGDLGSGRYGWYLKDENGNVRAITRSDGTLQLVNGEFVLNDGVRDRVIIGINGSSYRIKLVSSTGKTIFDVDDAKGVLDIKYKDGLFDGISNDMLYWNVILGNTY